MELGKYSFGIGDRFGREGKAQLKALLKARNLGVEITPVWNKSNREHQIIGTHPVDVRNEADEAVSALGYLGPYFVDADHITELTVGPFLEVSDFFTVDVAGFIGKKASDPDLLMAKEQLLKLGFSISIPGMEEPILLENEFVDNFLNTYLSGILSAVSLYRRIEQEKGPGNFITEVSMDEVQEPQTPRELLLILFLLASHAIPLQTIAPKFSGRFNKGVDYIGALETFRKEFESDLCVIKYAVANFGLPKGLKLSIHSGSDKFSIYPIIGELIRKLDMGIHIKTAGTTWLEEVIGLCLGDVKSVNLVKELYHEALLRQEELCKPYADVIGIDPSKLPAEVHSWTGLELAEALRHEPDHPNYNSSLRQLLHVGYKLAAERGTLFLEALERNAGIIALQVEENLYDRHIRRLF